VQINFHSPEEDSYISNSGLGVKTFITPHTAFGVGLNYSKKLSGDLYYEDSTNLNGSFSIYY
jgi:hypothetical protein